MIVRRGIVVALAASLLAGCGPQSRVDRAAAITVRSRARLQSGAPAAGIPVALSRESSAGEFFAGFFLASLTVFTACLADPPPDVCRRGFRRTLTTGDDGAIDFEVTGKDTQSAFGTASQFALAARLPAAGDEVAGPVTTYRFRIQADQLTLPELRLWQPAFALGANQARWDRLPAEGYGQGSGYRVVFEDTAGTPVWGFDADATQLSFDARFLEDSRGSAAVVAKRRLSVDALYTSARRSYSGTAGAPPSRGKPCSIAVAGQRATTALTPCPLTDGDFQRTLPTESAASASSTSTPAASTATIDLGAAQAIALVVVRGCACTLETSADGAAWSPLGDLGAADAGLVPPRATGARYVRARTNGSLTQLREISVWGG